MKRIFVVVVFFLSFSAIAQNWQTSFEEAKSKAIKENKNIVLVFSGSDWCAPCMKLEKNVWNSNVFQTEAEKNWVIYKADFPKKKANQLNPELTEQNKKLAEKFPQISQYTDKLIAGITFEGMESLAAGVVDDFKSILDYLPANCQIFLICRLQVPVC